MGLPPELERIVAHEDQKMGSHQEETELVDLGIGSGKREDTRRGENERSEGPRTAATPFLGRETLWEAKSSR